MSLTKALRKSLRSMSLGDKVRLERMLKSLLVSEKNPMIKSSLLERIQMIESNLSKKEGT